MLSGARNLFHMSVLLAWPTLADAPQPHGPTHTCMRSCKPAVLNSATYAEITSIIGRSMLARPVSLQGLVA